MNDKPLSSTEAAELERLIAQATDSDLVEDGRYFHETCRDLTSCYHGDTGNFGDPADAKLVVFLWNNRRRILASLAAPERDAPLPIPLPLDSGPLKPSRAGQGE